MVDIDWNEDSYLKFLNYLYSLQDLKYREFYSGLGINKDYFIGVRTPFLKKISKEISLGDYKTFITYNSHSTYEEILIHGFVIGYIHEDFKAIKHFLLELIPYIDNWSLCDLVCSNLHIWNDNTKNGLKFVKTLLKSSKMWYKRFGFVLLLNYYLNDEYIYEILEIIKSYDTDEYYVMMAIAWLLSLCYIKYPSLTEELLKSRILNKKIQNKTIQKIRESKRVNNNIKEKILQWRM